MNDSYQIYAKPSPDLEREIKQGKYRPREGYLFSGSMQQGQWVLLNYRKAENVLKLRAEVAKQDQHNKETESNG